MPSLSHRLVASLAVALALIVTLSGSAMGLDWSLPERVTDTRPSELSALHELASASGRLHLVHGRVGPKADDDRLVYQRSPNGGRGWSAEQTLFAATEAQRILIRNFAVVAEGDLVAVAWRTRGVEGTSLWVRRSEDRGSTWRPRQLVAETPIQRGLGVPALSASGDTVMAAWTDRATGPILLRRSVDGARTFGVTRVMGRTSLSIDCDAEVLDGLVGLGVAGAIVHLAWSDGRDRGCVADALLVRSSKDGGRTWRAQRRASRQPTYGWPEMTARGTVLLMTLQRPDGGFVVVRSRDTGATFRERAFRPTRDRALGAADILLAGGGAAWLVYTDIAYEGPDVVASRVRFRVSTDNGRTWGAGTAVVGHTDKLRQATNVVAHGTTPVVVFQTGPTDGSASDIVVVRAE